MRLLTIACKWLAGAGLLLAAQLGVAGTLAGSAHDFTTAAWNPGQKACVVCHAPHNGSLTVTDAPLWSHATTTATYQVYASPTMSATLGQPGGNSKLCLSCHDGTVAVDSFGGTTGTIKLVDPLKNNVGTDLRDDHPIGFLYNTALATADGSLFDPATKTVTIGVSPSKTGTLAAMLLFNGKMECSSCHDVHNTFVVGAKGTGMVKMDTIGSKICIACHNK